MHKTQPWLSHIAMRYNPLAAIQELGIGELVDSRTASIPLE